MTKIANELMSEILLHLRTCRSCRMAQKRLAKFFGGKDAQEAVEEHAKKDGYFIMAAPSHKASIGWKELAVRIHRDSDFAKRSVRVKGEHFLIEPESSDFPMRGFGGGRFLIHFKDGRLVETTNLWSQGKIPEELRKRIPDNAEFLKDEKRGIYGMTFSAVSIRPELQNRKALTYQK